VRPHPASGAEERDVGSGSEAEDHGGAQVGGRVGTGANRGRRSRRCAGATESPERSTTGTAGGTWSRVWEDWRIGPEPPSGLPGGSTLRWRPRSARCERTEVVGSPPDPCEAHRQGTDPPAVSTIHPPGSAARRTGGLGVPSVAQGPPEVRTRGGTWRTCLITRTLHAGPTS
jgi:hypothetical protein